MELEAAVTVSASNNVETVLLLNERAGTMLPHSTAAFSVSAGSKKRVIQRNVGSLIIYRNGSVFRLQNICFLGLRGESIWRRAFSFANEGARRISVTQLPLIDLSFAKVRELVIENIRRHPDVLEHFFDKQESPEKVLMSVASCSNCEELFDALGVPAPQDTLDALSGT